MNKARIARIARLVALRQQQRRIQEAVHAQAQRELDLMNQQRESYAVRCATLDREHDETLQDELDPADLELLGAARQVAGSRLKEADTEVAKANDVADSRRDELLAAHRAHRSLEMFHGRIQNLYCKELARNEQKDLDELAQRSAGAWRMW